MTTAVDRIEAAIENKEPVLIYGDYDVVGQTAIVLPKPRTALYRGAAGYSWRGHVAFVIAVSPATYTVSEMNFLGWGQVNTRTVPWPDHHLSGFIPFDGG